MEIVQQFSQDDAGFEQRLVSLLDRQQLTSEEVKQQVGRIIQQVRKDGDEALVSLTNRFDHRQVKDPAMLEIEPSEMKAALSRLDDLTVGALQESISRVRAYHVAQKERLGGDDDWQFTDSDGNTLGQIIKPMRRAGMYVPGGKASYPSSVIMTVIPARVAGVEEIVLTVPAPGGEISDLLLAAASLCQVDRLFTIGGAQAIAAMAYGTSRVPRVDKIVGPGNIYVATAKRMVFGDVGIDMIAGPSEIVIVADESANPDWLALDLFAQAEHDEMAQSILISPNQVVLDRVQSSIERLVSQMSREGIIRESLGKRGALIKVSDLSAAADLANRLAPEHLELSVADPDSMLGLIQNAGAIFMGHHSPEVVGDYAAGPSHVLPTSGSARFSSPLGVYDFLVRSSVVHCSPRGSIRLSRASAIIARHEGLDAHARSAEARLQG